MRGPPVDQVYVRAGIPVIRSPSLVGWILYPICTRIKDGCPTHPAGMVGGPVGSSASGVYGAIPVSHPVLTRRRLECHHVRVQIKRSAERAQHRLEAAAITCAARVSDKSVYAHLKNVVSNVEHSAITRVAGTDRSGAIHQTGFGREDGRSLGIVTDIDIKTGIVQSQ